MNDEQEIRDLIERWAAAVHAGDIAGVVADHGSDIVMFDVPPPEQGIRGIEAYRESWPGFFGWQAAGAVFEIESLDVTAGSDVAFAFALLRCGAQADFDRDPDSRLRLTIGLAKRDGRWTVTHEHHSFAYTGGLPEAPAEEIRSIHQEWFDDTAADDLDGMMKHIDPDIVSYEHGGPLQYVGIDEVRAVCARGLESATSPIKFDIPDLTIRGSGEIAVSWGLDHIVADGVESYTRGTRIFQRRDGDWYMIHQHLSSPAEEG